MAEDLIPPIVHAGDPVLRTKAQPVSAAGFKSPELQKLIDLMVGAMREAPGVGLAAPQLGIDLQIIVVEDSAEGLADLDPEGLARRSRVPVPLTTIVNPVLRVIDDRPEIFFEGCLSVPGYSALVPRAREVEVEGFTPEGAPFLWRVSGWPARILQHEVDHLDGTLYVDRMLARSFSTIAQAHARWTELSLADVRRALGIP